CLSWLYTRVGNEVYIGRTRQSRRVQVPAHRLLQAVIQLCRGFPTQFTAYLAGVQGIANVVARPVPNETDQLPVGPDAGRVGRTVAFQQVADFAHQVDIPAFIITADQVGLPDPPLDQHA